MIAAAAHGQAMETTRPALRSQNCGESVSMGRIQPNGRAETMAATISESAAQMELPPDEEPTSRTTFGLEDEPTAVAAPGGAKRRSCEPDDGVEEFGLAPTSVMAREMLEELAERTRDDGSAPPPVTEAPATSASPAPTESPAATESNNAKSCTVRACGPT